MLDKIINILYPNACPICGKTLKIKELLCKSCEKKLEYIKEPICKKCGKQLEIEEQEYCGDCKKYVHVFDSGIGVFAYTDEIKKCIYDFKYNDMKIYSKFFGKKMAEYGIGYIKHWDADVIIPIPVSKKKYTKRGYNQAELIAKELSLCCSVPMDNKVLYRKKNTKPQKEMKRETRKKNLENAFIISQNVVKYKKVILVDDIYTTGSTMDECAQVLKDAGVLKVHFLSLSIGAGV